MPSSPSLLHKRGGRPIEANIQLTATAVPVLHLNELGGDRGDAEIVEVLGYAVWCYG